jgi:hypothetical protein
VEKITYVKVAYDSLLGVAFTPIIYNYSIPMVTNGTLQRLQVTRTVTQPDILFTAADLVSAPTTIPLVDNEYTRGYAFLTNGIVSLGGGVSAQVIGAQELIVFNNVTPIYYNDSPNFLDQLQNDGFPNLLWGSFDGSTNAPVVFPIGSSVEVLEQEILEGGASLPPGTYNPLSALNSNSTNTSTATVAAP